MNMKIPRLGSALIVVLLGAHAITASAAAAEVRPLLLAAAETVPEGDGTRVDDRVDRRQTRRETVKGAAADAAANYEGDGTRVDDRVERRQIRRETVKDDAAE